MERQHQYIAPNMAYDLKIAQNFLREAVRHLEIAKRAYFPEGPGPRKVIEGILIFAEMALEDTKALRKILPKEEVKS